MRKNTIIITIVVWCTLWQADRGTAQTLGREAGAASARAASGVALKAQVSMPVPAAEGPFARESTLPYHMPPFDKIKDSDYRPAFEAGMAEQRKEVDAIAHNPQPAVLRQHHRCARALGPHARPRIDGVSSK